MTKPNERRARVRAARGLAQALVGLSLAIGPTLPAAAQEVDAPDVAVAAAPDVAVDAAPDVAVDAASDAGASAADAPVDPCQPPYSDRDTACVLTQSADTYGYLDAGQFNVYRVDAPAPQPLKTELLDLSSDLDLYLYDAENQEWGESVHEDTTPEVIDLTVPKLDTYYLYVVADAGRPIDPSLPYHLHVTLGDPLTTVVQVDTAPVTPSDDGHDGKLPPQLPPPAPIPPAVAAAASAPTAQPVAPAVTATPQAAASTTTTTSSAGSSTSPSTASSSSGNSGSSPSRSDPNPSTPDPTPSSTDNSPVSPPTVPSSMKVEATGPDGASVSYSASASGGATVDCSPGPGKFPLGTTSVTCTATGANGKQASASFNVTVSDTTAPSLKLPDPMTVAAGSGPVSYSVSATDLVDPSPSVTCNPPSGSTFQPGSQKVTCTATDKSGNQASGSFLVSVTDWPPLKVVLSSPPAWNKSPVTITATVSGGAPDKTINYSVNGSSTTVHGDSASVSVSDENSYSVSVHASDSAGHSADAGPSQFKIDKTPPTITVPSSPIRVEVPTIPATVNYSVSVKDNLDPNPSLSCSPASGSPFGVGTTTVTCNAGDAAGNSATASFPVTVIRMLPPPPPRNPCDPRVFLAPMLSGDQNQDQDADLEVAAIPNCPFPF